jgi:hypothetical protein|tara:strand:+ start:3724 stop:4125 length:402 start_codon:yes stop_codon:yes gene_type:complete
MLGLISAILPIAETVLDRVIPDKNAKAKALLEMEKALVDAHNKGMLAQIDVNKVEAAHRSIFVAGWRPCIGWVGAISIAWHFILQPITIFALGVFDLPYDLPAFDMDAMLTIIMGMLGIGGMRSFEKFKGLTK